MIQSIVDLHRYPILDTQAGGGRSVVEACHRQFRETGLCMLPGFLQPEALSTMVGEAQRLSGEAHITEQYGGSDTSTDPRATHAKFGAVAYDRLADDSLLRALYEWDGLTSLVEAIVNQPLNRTADPLVSCTLSYFSQGDELGWHYDSNEATVSLLLQAADEGGAFELVPRTRGHGVDAKEREQAVLDGQAEHLISPDLTAGTLSIFNGNQALHRVSPNTGKRQRIVALLNYAAEADYVFNEQVHMRFFGRTSPSMRKQTRRIP